MSDDLTLDQHIVALEAAGYVIKNPEEPRKKIRLIYYGDSPSVATGFGKVASNILPRLWETGDYEIMCFGVNYWGVPHPYPFQIYPMLPNHQGDPYGREKVMQVIPNIDFDIAFFLQDSFIMTFIPQLIEECKKKGKNFRTLSYFPIDGTPWPEWIEAMSATDISVTYTEWGRKECVKAYPPIGDKLQVIPHGISLKEFYPKSPEERLQIRKMLFGQYADKFIVINVNRNQQRKDLPRSVMAFREFKKDCPDSVMYFHCAEQDVGWNMPRIVQHLGLKPGEDVLFPRDFNVNQGFPVAWMNDLYNAADVNISTTLGGGWELSSVEALSCRIPCIFPNNSALTEIFADGRGFLCRSGDTPNMRGAFPMDNDIIRPFTNIEDMVKYLKRLYEDKKSGGRIAKQMTDKAYKWVVENLQWEKHIVPRFDAMFRALYADLQTPQENKLIQEVGKGWRKGEVI